MHLPLAPPVAPMLARLTRDLPLGAWAYEPKWDGFRCVVFRDGDEVELTSRNERSLIRYFPEVVASVLAEAPERCVLDSELVVAGTLGLDFEALSQRIHPATSRVTKLARETPASLMAFDLLALGDLDLRPIPFARRRAALVGALAGSGPGLHLTPCTEDAVRAAEWFRSFEGAGLDGVMAKGLEGTYLEDVRAMVKVKHERSCEFVVGGFRWYRGEQGRSVGSLLLGLYEAGVLCAVGTIGSFPAEQRRRLAIDLEPLRATTDHPWAAWASGPGTAGRWNTGRDQRFEPLRPDLVVEASYDKLAGRRLRHTARFRRWRPERDPASCTFEQLEVPVPTLLSDLLDFGG